MAREYLIKIKLLYKLFKVSYYEFLTENIPVCFSGAVELWALS